MDWVTIAGLATAAGTLVLAIATFGATRSSNRAARAAERSVAAGLRPLLVSSRDQDAPQKIGFADTHFVVVEGGRGTAEATDDAVYLTMSLRNLGAGVAVLIGWDVAVGALRSRPGEQRPDPATFRRLTRDIYVPAGDIGFWQGSLRDPAEPMFADVKAAVERREPLTIHVLYGDVEGGQRVISRFTLLPVRESAWLASVARHWNLDRPDPR
jgi:hypothetical protein